MTPATLAALVAYIEREAVPSARVLAVTRLYAGAASAELVAGDGSRWWIVAAPDGAAFGWAETEADAIAACAADLRDRARALTEASMT